MMRLLFSAMLAAASAQADPGLSGAYGSLRAVAAQAPKTSLCLAPELAELAKTRLSFVMDEAGGGKNVSRTLLPRPCIGSGDSAVWSYVPAEGDYMLRVTIERRSLESYRDDRRTGGLDRGVVLASFVMRARDARSGVDGGVLFRRDGLSHYDVAFNKLP